MDQEFKKLFQALHRMTARDKLSTQLDSRGSDTDISKLKRSGFEPHLILKSSKNDNLRKRSQEEQINNKNKHNNSDIPLTSRRTDGGKKNQEQFWLSFDVKSTNKGKVKKERGKTGKKVVPKMHESKTLHQIWCANGF